MLSNCGMLGKIRNVGSLHVSLVVEFVESY